MLNRVTLIGNLGKDPNVRYTTSGTAVCEFSLATTEKWTDKSGEKREETQWHNVQAWGKLAEICGQHLAKGRSVYVEGGIKYQSYDGKDGQKRYKTVINAQRVQFLGGGKREDEGASGGGGQSQSGQLDDDDVPFIIWGDVSKDVADRF